MILRDPTVRRHAVHRHLLATLSCAALLLGTSLVPVRAQTPPPAGQTDDQAFSVEQLDALLAPIALYPDQLLTQTLMASTYPLQVVEAARWVDDPANKTLQGDALTQALAQKTWDPSVKSLVPFPQVLAMMNSKLDWTQQLGYAMAVQQNAVMDSVQRLRRQAQGAGQLQTTTQQVVRTEGQTVLIVPAQPNVVYVPVYNPTVVYGTWPYPSYQPVYWPPPPGYAVGTALMTGLAFGTGVAISAGLWGWASPNWRAGNVDVNVNRYNNINVNRPPISNSNWRPAAQATRPGGAAYRPPSGPVGAAARSSGVPANAIGRSNVAVPGNAVRPPSGMGPGNRPPISPGATNRPAGGQPATAASGRPGGSQALNQANRPGGSQNAVPTPGAFSGMADGRNAAQFGNRGAESRQSTQASRGGGGIGAGGGARAGGRRLGQ